MCAYVSTKEIFVDGKGVDGKGVDGLFMRADEKIQWASVKKPLNKVTQLSLRRHVHTHTHTLSLIYIQSHIALTHSHKEGTKTYHSQSDTALTYFEKSRLRLL